MPGIATTRTSIPLGGRGLSGDAYWIWFWERSGDFLFFASDSTNILNKVATTQLPNQIIGSSDFLTVTGTGLNARYRTPDNATYRTADSDYVFWKTDASESTCDGNRLIGYDFPRILVKYLNVAPYTILWIGILKPGVTVTNSMRDSFDLNIWWNNTLSFHGNTKQNKPLPQQYVWTAESVIEAETAALVARMTAVSETPDAARITVLDTAIAADKTSIGFTNQYDAMWLLAAHGNDSALLNIIKASHNITLVNTPDFLQDRHYVGNASDEALNCNYNPSTEASKYLQNAASFGVYIRNNVDGLYDAISALAGASIGISFNVRYSNQKYIRMNSDYAGSVSLDSSGMWIISRTGANLYNIYRNGTILTDVTTASASLPNTILHLLCRNLSGTLTQHSPYQLALAFVGGVMDQTKVTAFQTIWVDGYLNDVGAKV
jgi:hypothetical protein